MANHSLETGRADLGLIVAYRQQLDPVLSFGISFRCSREVGVRICYGYLRARNRSAACVRHLAIHRRRGNLRPHATAREDSKQAEKKRNFESSTHWLLQIPAQGTSARVRYSQPQVRGSGSISPALYHIVRLRTTF